MPRLKKMTLRGGRGGPAFECAERLGDSERGFGLLEHLLECYASGRIGRTLPDDFPIDDPRIAGLWQRPAQATLAKALAAGLEARVGPRRRR